MSFNRTYTYRLSPNRKQETLLKQYTGSCRFIYNFFLHFNMEQFARTKKTVSVPDMLNALELLKRKQLFLTRIPEQVLKGTLITLKSDIHASLKQNQSFPPFRKKGKDDFFTVISDFELDSGYLSIPGIPAIRFRNSRPIDGTLKTVKVLKRQDDWLFVALILRDPPPPVIRGHRTVGIDVGLKEFAFLSTGHVIPNPRFYRALEDKLNTEQRKLARKVLGSNSWLRQKRKIQKLHRRIYNSRMNFLHKTSSYIVKHFDVIGIEKLPIRHMAKNRRLAKSIMDASWGTFIELLKYKAKEHSKKVIEVDRFYPSSQLCSNCGERQFMPLHLRTFSCKHCRHELDRDYNAAKNIEMKASELAVKKMVSERDAPTPAK